MTWTIETHRLWYRELDDGMSPAETLLDARNKKDLGNEHFHHRDWKKAGSNYQDVLKHLNVWNYDEASPERVEAEATYVHCANNLIFALMKMDEWLKAERAVCDVLCVAPEDRKSLYRATQVALHLSKWKEADAALELALTRWPNSPHFRELYETLRAHRAKYRARKKAMSKKMATAIFAEKSARPADPDDPNSSSDDDDDDAAAAELAAAAVGDDDDDAVWAARPAAEEAPPPPREPAPREAAWRSTGVYAGFAILLALAASFLLADDGGGDGFPYQDAPAGVGGEFY